MTKNKGIHIKSDASSGRYASFVCIVFMLGMLALFVSCGADRNFKKGEKYLALGEYYDAAAQYKQAYTKTKKDGNCCLK